MKADLLAWFYAIVLAFVVLLVVTAGHAAEGATYFTRDELCNGQSPCDLDASLMDGLDCIRTTVGKPVIVTSGYRSPSRNTAVGGVVGSLHVSGRAADIKVAGVSPRTVAEVARQCGFGGIGTYDRHVHVDTGPARRWTGTSR